MEFLAGQAERVRALQPKRRIVFPEGGDPRVVAAAERLAREGLVEPILIGPKPSNGLRFIDPETSPQTAKYAALYAERRRAQSLTEAEALRQVKRPLWFAALK